MRYCAQCGAAAQADAVFCHKCGVRLVAADAPAESAPEEASEAVEPAAAAAPRRSNRSLWFSIGAVVGLLFLISLFAAAPNPNPPAPGPSQTVSGAVSGTTPAPGNSAEAAPENWQYTTERDEMRGADERIASVRSTNSLHFDFPYGESHGRVSIRQSPRFGFDVFLTIDNGQFVCHSFTGGRIAAKFDDEPIRNYACNNAADGSPTILFIGNPRDFLSRLRRARRLVIEVDFYQAGRQQLRFDVAGLRWAEGAPPRSRR